MNILTLPAAGSENSPNTVISDEDNNRKLGFGHEQLRPTTRRDLRHFVRRILRVEGAADVPLRSMSTANCKRILAAAFGASPSSYRKGRVILSSVFSYGIRQEWADSNPVTRIEVPAVQEKPIEPLAPEEVERLKATTSRPEFRDMRFSLSLMFYGGIHPTEVSRLQDGDINWEEGHVIIRPRASKTGGGRAVPLRGVRGIRKRDRHIPPQLEAQVAGLTPCRRIPPLGAGCLPPHLRHLPRRHVPESPGAATGDGPPRYLAAAFTLHGTRPAQSRRAAHCTCIIANIMIQNLRAKV